MDFDHDGALYVFKLILWVLASFLFLAALRLLILTTIIDLPFIKQRLTAWLATLKLGMLLIAVQAFLFNITMALRLVVTLTESEPLLELTMYLFYVLFELILLASLLVIGNVVRGGGPPTWRQYREISKLIDGMEKGDMPLTLSEEIEEELL